MEFIMSSGRELSRELENPDLTGKEVPTGLPPRPVEFICRRPSALRRPENPPKDIPSPEGEIPSDPAFR